MLDQLSREDLSYDRKLQIAQYLYENTGDASGFRELGFTDAQIAALQNSYTLAMQQYFWTGTSGGSSGSGSSGGSYSGGSYSGGSYGSSDNGASLSDLNTSSVLALGIGPVDFETVERLVEEGKVEVYQDGGKVGVKWANGYNASNYNDQSSAWNPLLKLYGG